MIYITGDTHGDFSRIERFCEQVQPSRDDIMIILGDAGFNYYGGKRDHRVKERMSGMPITIFSIHGNTENDGMTANRATRQSRSHVDGANRLHHEKMVLRGGFEHPRGEDKKEESP